MVIAQVDALAAPGCPQPFVAQDGAPYVTDVLPVLSPAISSSDNGLALDYAASTCATDTPAMTAPQDHVTPLASAVEPKIIVTPVVKRKSSGNPSIKTNPGSLMGLSQIACIDDNEFEAYYLRKIEPNWSASWTTFRNEAMENVQNNSGEATMYPFIIKLLTEICLYIYEGGEYFTVSTES